MTVPNFLKPADSIEFKVPSKWLAASFNLAPVEAVKFFQGKGLKPSWNWWEMQGEQHTAAFTVAKMLDTDLLKTVKDSVDYAIESGLGTEWLNENLVPELQKKGWWGKKESLFGGKPIQLGSPARMQTIYRTNMQSAYAVGQWDAIQEAKVAMPYLMYDAIDDLRTRPEHAMLDNIVRKVGDPFWSSHYPPNGWNCRCTVIQLSRDDLEEYGLKETAKKNLPGTKKEWENPLTGKTELIPAAIDPGFNYNPGAAYASHIGKIYKQKVNALPAQMKAAVKKAPTAPSAEDLAIVAAKAKAQAEAAAKLKKSQATLDDILANPKGQTNKLKALQNLQKAGTAKELDATALLSQVEALAAQAQEKANLSNLVSKYKKAVLDGKTPSEGMVAAVKQLEPAKHAKLMDDLDGAVKAKLANEAAIKAKAEAIDNFLMLKAGELPDPSKALASAFKQLEVHPEWSGYSVAEQWAMVSEQAAQIKAKKAISGQLTKYKTAVVKGKKPPPAAQAAYDSLGADDLAKFDAKLAEQLDDAAVKIPKGVEDISPENLDVLEKVLLEDDLPYIHEVLSESGWQNLDDLEFMLKGWENNALDAEDIENVLKIIGAEMKGLKTVYGKGGKVLLKSEADEILEEVAEAAAAKVAKAAQKPPVPKTPANKAPVFEDLTQTGPQRGSNPGGKFKDPETGQEYYIKLPKSEDYARNEALAAKLYEAAGIEAPEVFLINIDGAMGKGKGIASKIIDGLSENSAKLRTGTVQTATDGFMTDAWLANHDVVGLGFDNLLMKGTKAIRVDTGGALRYRAQGGTKATWGNVVEEIDSMRHAGTNSNAASVFGKMSKADLDQSAARVLAVTDDAIRKAVKEYGPLDAAENAKLIETLIARKADIKRRFPGAKPKKPAPVKDAGKPITAVEQNSIKQSRGNGYVRPTDGDEIEDQAVLLWQQKNVDGAIETAASLKLRAKGLRKFKAKLDVDLKASSTRADIPKVHQQLDRLDQELKDAVIGIKHRMGNGGLIDAKDVGRVADAEATFIEISQELRKLRTAKSIKMVRADKILEHYEPWIKDMKAAIKRGAGEAFDSSDLKMLNNSAFLKPVAKPKLIEKVVEVKPSTKIHAERKYHQFTTSRIKKGNIERTKAQNHFEAEVYEIEVDDVLVRYFTGAGKGGSTSEYFAIKDTIEVIAPGGTKASGEKIYDALKKLGINTKRPDALDVEERYLMQIFYHRNENFRSISTSAKKFTSQEQRVVFLREQLERDTGKRIDDMVGYKPHGERQAFDQGRVHTYRPDLDGADWDGFQKDYRLIHNNTDGSLVSSIENILNSGGQMAPTTDKLRRGIQVGGMSPSSDMSTGGASYFFTRIRSARSSKSRAGLVWDSRLVARNDAISYSSDMYGKTIGDTVTKNRRTGVSQWRSTGDNGGSNETIFKGSLSLFDDLEHIVADTFTERMQIIEIFKKNGYNRWPDGRALETVIIETK